MTSWSSWLAGSSLPHRVWVSHSQPIALITFQSISRAESGKKFWNPPMSLRSIFPCSNRKKTYGSKTNHAFSDVHLSSGLFKHFRYPFVPLIKHGNWHISCYAMKFPICNLVHYLQALLVASVAKSFNVVCLCESLKDVRGSGITLTNLTRSNSVHLLNRSVKKWNLATLQSSSKSTIAQSC